MEARSETVLAKHELALRNGKGLHVEAWLGLILIPLFWILDHYMIPAHVNTLFWLRAVPTSFAAGLLLLHQLDHERFVRWSLSLSFGFSLVVAVTIVSMCFLHEGYESPYYAGINLVVMCVGLLYAWELKVAVAFGALVAVSYFMPLLVGLATIQDDTTARSNFFFLVGGLVITLVSQHNRRGLELNQILALIKEKRLRAEMWALATTDPLTSVYNRRQFVRLGGEEILRSQRYQRPMTVIMLDIDHFKPVNDTYGHAVGDEVLIAVAHRITAALRTTDILGRYGGEEFAIVLPETEAAVGVEVVGERLRQAICGTPVETSAGRLGVTVSIGVTEVSVRTEGLTEALGRADSGLYLAKRSGRNRVVHQKLLPA